MVPTLTVRERMTHFAVRTAVVFAALLFLLPFISPIHRLPLPTFDSECLAGLLLAISLSALLFAPPAKATLNWPLPVLLAIMIALATYQYLAGRLDYSYQLTTLVLAAVGILAAYGLGRWFVAANMTTAAVYAICAAVVAGGVFSSAVQWMQVLDVSGLPFWMYFPMEREQPFRAVANLGQPNQLAAYFAMGLVSLLYLQSRGWPTGAVRVFAAALSGGIALTQSRMGMLMALLLALGCLIGPLRAFAGERRSAAIYWIASFAGYALAWIAGPLLATNLEGAIAADNLLSQSTLQIRLVMWADAFKVIASAPLLGVGVGQYADAQYWLASLSPSTEGTPYVHNVLLQIAAEFGVFVGLFFLGLLLWWALADRKSRLADPATAAVWTLGLLIVLHSLLEWPLWVFFVAVPAGMLFGLGEPEVRRAAVRLEARKVLGPIGFAALFYVPLMFVDYDRVSLASQLLYRDQFVGKATSLEAQVAVLEIGDATFFKPQMDRQVLSVLSPRKPVEAHDIELTRRVLSRLPDDRVIARYITLLALDGKVDEAVRHVDRMRVFAQHPERYGQAEQIVLKGIADEGPQLDTLRQRLAEMRR